MSKSIVADFRRRFFSGLLIVLPILITALILRFLFNIIAGLFSPLMNHFFPEIPIWVKFVSSSLILILVIYFLGVITGHLLVAGSGIELKCFY